VNSAPRARDRDIIEDSPTGLQPITLIVLTHLILLHRSTNRASTTLVHRRLLIPQELTLDYLRTIFTNITILEALQAEN
jgi:hypothetical protein